MSDTPTAPRAGGAARGNRRTLVLIALVTVAPVIASYAAYYWFPRERQVNYGELLPTGPAPAVAGTVGGTAFRLRDLRGKWVLALAAPGECDAACKAALYATRQARTIQNREMERVTRVWFVTDGAAPSPGLVAEHPDLVVVRDAATALSDWPRGPDRLYLLDPLGNLVLAYPREPDIKRLAQDLTRLLKASRIG